MKNVKYDILTGADTTAQGYKSPIKKMCLNCNNFICRPSGESNEEYFCDNENVLESGRKKILESVPEGFKISVLEMEPMQLKDPTKKCKNHSLDEDLVEEELIKQFN